MTVSWWWPLNVAEFLDMNKEPSVMTTKYTKPTDVEDGKKASNNIVRLVFVGATSGQSSNRKVYDEQEKVQYCKLQMTSPK